MVAAAAGGTPTAGSRSGDLRAELGADSTVLAEPLAQTVSEMNEGTRYDRRDATRPRAARPLDQAKDIAILEAAITGLAEQGYDRLSVDDIAARAGVGKAAIYRRWSSKSDLVAAAIVWQADQAAEIEAPDTGSLRGDLEAVLASVPEFAGGDSIMTRVILGAAPAAREDPIVAAAVAEHAFARPRALLETLLERAERRGEIPSGHDRALVAEVMLGLNLLRTATGGAIDRAYVRRVFDEVILPLVAAPSR